MSRSGRCNSSWRMLPFFIGTRWDNYGVFPGMRLWKCSSAPKERASSWTTKKMAGKGFAFIISTMVTNYDAQYGHWLGVLPICVATTPGHEILCYSYYINGAHTDVTVEDISKHLKLAAGLLNYPTRKGIPVERVDTHSLQGGRCERARFVGVFGNGNPKNGTMERGHVQIIHSGRAGKLCRWYVHGDENKVQLHELCWQCIPRHHGNSIDNGVQHRIQYRWSGINHSNEQIFSGHEAALG